jgi:putative flippase GtrA
MNRRGETLIRLVKYTLVGATGTLAQFAILIGLMEGLHWHDATLASTLGAIAGAFVNYALNYRFTFNSQKNHTESLPKFMATATLGFILNAAAMALLTQRGQVQYVIAQVISTAGVFMVTFIVNSAWTFKNKKVND